MQYSPKLKKAMAEIDLIIKKYDVAAFILLHTPGFSEYLNRISPSYSCATQEGGQLRIRLKTAEVGEEKARQLANDTLNMAVHFSDMINMHAIGYKNFKELLLKHWPADEGDGIHTSHTDQNN